MTMTMTTCPVARVQGGAGGEAAGGAAQERHNVRIVGTGMWTHVLESFDTALYRIVLYDLTGAVGYAPLPSLSRPTHPPAIPSPGLVSRPSYSFDPLSSPLSLTPVSSPSRCPPLFTPSPHMAMAPPSPRGVTSRDYVAAGLCSVQLFLYSPDLRTCSRHRSDLVDAVQLLCCGRDSSGVPLVGAARKAPWSVALFGAPSDGRTNKRRVVETEFLVEREFDLALEVIDFLHLQAVQIYASVAASLAEKQQHRVLFEGLMDRIKYMLPPADMDEVLFNVACRRLRLAFQIATGHSQPQGGQGGVPATASTTSSSSTGSGSSSHGGGGFGPVYPFQSRTMKCETHLRFGSTAGSGWRLGAL
ncbi:unnamed protein product [Closterium sp. Naga37s-1]|nr:unnamed protein product [Closterium sp. Naga37s-1]